MFMEALSTDNGSVHGRLEKRDVDTTVRQIEQFGPEWVRYGIQLFRHFCGRDGLERVESALSEVAAQEVQAWVADFRDWEAAQRKLWATDQAARRKAQESRKALASRAAAYVQEHCNGSFPGVRKLARAMQCGTGSLSNAIASSHT
jgi:hypothetical protein